ncbi:MULTISPECIES: hypothetical protein [Lysinibacillus]|uniref:hypothetical protein n=1 Tax=Lysinibacillus TaxID=400634 RepID=UPI00104D98E9|nr:MULTISPECIES: hypothetical protein [Lysinibacillus]MEB2282699.1 hypothetical protein [Lysinibacillus xylanilyticus]UPW81486.1 hypothetical protein MY533_12030 [Lysinibacillus sp. Ag94]
MSHDQYHEEHDNILHYCFTYSLEVKYYYMMVKELKKGRRIQSIQLGDRQLLICSYKLPNSIDLCVQIPIVSSVKQMPLKPSGTSE